MKKITHAHDSDATRLGFWLYILSDVMIFGALFATFMVLRHNVASGPTARDIIDPGQVLIMTIALVVSSFTAAVALLAAKTGRLHEMRFWLAATFVLGVIFLSLELKEFTHLIVNGHSWKESAFLSSFFALVGTHGLHVLVGLTWLGSWLWYYSRRGLDDHMVRKLGLFTLFWHFVDVVWIGVFTIVYMFGVAL